MKTELIKALRETVLDLELNRKEYDWMKVNSCNCGILAQNICGMDDDTLTANRDIGAWSLVCKSTGENMSVVMKKMLSVGLTLQNIIDLEKLSSPEILKEASLNTWGVAMDNKELVIRYMKAWIRILEREEVVPEIKPINAAPNKPMQFISYEEMKTEMELLFQN